MEYKISTKRKGIIDKLLFFHHRQLKKRVLELSLMYDKKGIKVIEIGAGANPLNKYFSKAEYILTDMVKYEGIDEIADVTNLHYKDNSFDLVICNNVLEHIPDPKRAINEMYRILKEEGDLFLVTPFLFPLHDIPYDFYRFTEFSLKNMLAKFSHIFVTNIYLFPFHFGIFERLILYYIAIAKK